MNLNRLTRTDFKFLVFLIIPLVLLCQSVSAATIISIVYDKDNRSSRLAQGQLAHLFLSYDFEYQFDELNSFDPLPYTGNKTDSSANEQRIIITLGSKAFSKVWNLVNNESIFSLLVSQEKIRRVLAESKNTNKLSGLYLEQSIARQVELAQHLIPGIRSIGFLTTPDNKPALDRQLEAIKSQLSFDIKQVNDQSSLASSLSYLVRNNELLIALSEPKIYNRSSLKNILLSSYRNNVPLIGLNKAFVDAGSLAAVYSDIEQFSKETTEIMSTASRSRSLPDINYSKYFNIAINQKVARSLGLYTQSESDILNLMR